MERKKKRPALPDPGWNELVRIIAEKGPSLVAFSGGVDSTLLLAAAHEALGRDVKAVLVTGPFTPPWDAQHAKKMSSRLKVELIETDLEELSHPDIRENGPLRCYHCKHLRMSALKEMARELGGWAVLEGSHADDLDQDRPGSKALKELDVSSPLMEAGLGKAAIRGLSRKFGLSTAETPSSACLASRVQRGTMITPKALERIAKAEEGLRGVLKTQLRVRDHYPLARLELEERSLVEIMTQPVKDLVLRTVKDAGYGIVCIDLEGYRTGGADRQYGGSDE